MAKSSSNQPQAKDRVEEKKSVERKFSYSKGKGPRRKC